MDQRYGTESNQTRARASGCSPGEAWPVVTNGVGCDSLEQVKVRDGV